MTKQELSKKLKEALNLNSEKAGAEVIDKFTAVLLEAAKAGDEVTLGGFGKFVTVTKPARTCRNPKTGEMMEVPEKKAVKFKPAGNLKKVVNE